MPSREPAEYIVSRRSGIDQACYRTWARSAVAGDVVHTEHGEGGMR